MGPQVNCFLSCSIRHRDRTLLAALDTQVLTPAGFKCFTVGRNTSSPDQADDAVRRLVSQCDCLIGVATSRYEATDVDVPDRSLTLATPYLVQETAAAHQLQLPFLIFRVGDITLEGIVGRNLYIPIHRELSPAGKIRFACREELLRASLDSLRRRAVAYREKRKSSNFWSGAKTLGLVAAGAFAAIKSLEVLGRPACFGEFYYRNPDCKNCNSRTDCKAEKARRLA
jgi:hypothetical protein